MIRRLVIGAAIGLALLLAAVAVRNEPSTVASAATAMENVESWSVTETGRLDGDPFSLQGSYDAESGVSRAVVRASGGAGELIEFKDAVYMNGAFTADQGGGWVEWKRCEEEREIPDSFLLPPTPESILSVLRDARIDFVRHDETSAGGVSSGIRYTADIRTGAVSGKWNALIEGEVVKEVRYESLDARTTIVATFDELENALQVQRPSDVVSSGVLMCAY